MNPSSEKNETYKEDTEWYQKHTNTFFQNF